MLTSLSDLTIVCFAYEYIPALSCLNSSKFDLTWLTLIVCFDKLTTKENGFKKLNSAKAHDNFYICEKCIGYEIVFKLLRWDNSYRNFHCI